MGRPKGSRNSHPRDDQIIHATPAEMGVIVSDVLTMYRWPKINTADAQQVAARIDQYFQHCATNGIKPGVAGMALALGVDRTTLLSWFREEYRVTTHSPIVKSAYAALEAIWEHLSTSGKMNPAIAIFLAKNNFHYRDVVEQTVEVKNPLTDGLTATKQIEEDFAFVDDEPSGQDS